MMEENPNFHVSTKINGSTADFTVVEAEGNSIASTAISYSEISSGTTATVTTTYDNGAAAAGVGVYSIITNSFGLDVYDFAKDETRATTMSTTIDSRSDGVVIAGATNRNGGSISMTIDPSTTSEDYDQAMQSTDNMMTAITQFPTTTAVGKSITAESSVFPDDSSLAAVCFIPGS
jgi:hypothetical protein